MSRNVFPRLAGAAIIVAVAVYSISRAGNDKTPAKPADSAAPAGPKPAVASLGEKPAVAAPDPNERSAVEKALDKPIALKFKETPLKDVADAVGARAGINVLLDQKALTDAGITPDTPISFDVGHPISLRSALLLMLARHEMNFIVDSDNVLLITSDAKAKESVVLRVYDVRDLTTAMHTIAASEPQFDDLIDLITSIIAPTTWTESGGTGSISPCGTQLVVSQTREIHEQIAELLHVLREVRDDPQKFIDAGGCLPAPADSPEGKILAALGTVQDFDFHETPLTPVVENLRKRGIPAELDSRDLTAAGITGDTPITFKIKQARLDAALRLMLQKYEMSYLIDHEALLITSDALEKGHVVTRLYPIGDFIAAASANSEDETAEVTDALIDLITTTLSPTTWTDSGGTGAIAPFLSFKVLVVSQTPENHEQLTRLFATLRARRRAEEKLAADKPADANGMVTRLYRLSPEHGDAADEYVEVIRHLIAPKIWTEGEAYLGKVPGAIVVRCRPATQEEIHQLLDDLGALPPPIGQQRPFVTSGTPGVGNGFSSGEG